MAPRNSIRSDLPETYRPQLATLVKAAPSGDGWLHEVKYDGYRIGCFVDHGHVRLVSRNGKDWTDKFPEVVEAAQSVRVKTALFDGEVAILLDDGRTSFQLLQNAFGGGTRAGLVYFVFDLLHLDGENLVAQPLDERKAALKSLLGRGAGSGRLRYADHVTSDGNAVLGEACRLGLEGIISKRRDQPYRAGRNDGWVKIKCTRRQEFVIGGFTDPEGARAGIGALLAGFYDKGRLRFAGKVGTGFTQKQAAELRLRLEGIEQRECPFDPRPAGSLGRSAHWVKPELVGEVAFTEWTADGRIRHPSFQGLRSDKRAEEVIAENAAPPPQPERSAVSKKATTPRIPRTEAKRQVVAGVALSHPDRVLYPETGFTKLDLARYYEAIADWVLPHVKGRPLTLVRCPEGITNECFFMKHSNVRAPEALRRIRIQEKTKIGEYLIADDVAGLVSLVQMGVLEIHTWNSCEDRVEQPDRIVLDIDPGPQVKPELVVEAARTIRHELKSSGLESFVKTTGGAGLHVVAPLTPAADWTVCLEFSRRIAEQMARVDPSVYTTKFAKKGRERKILIDYLRNNRTNTSVAAFSTRSRPGAPVSVPVSWDELNSDVLVRPYGVKSVLQRLNRLKKDPWAAYWRSRQKIGP
jgi:bifunctional non-homologous end joining protein LigD